MGDQSLAARQHRLGVSRLGLHEPKPAFGRLGPCFGGRQCGAQGIDLVGGVHHAMKFTAWSQGLGEE